MKELRVLSLVALLALAACDAGPSAVSHDAPAVADDAEASMAIIDGSDRQPAAGQPASLSAGPARP
jgi:hypothetical protein